MQIQISWLLKKPTDLDLHCLQNRVYPGSAGQGLIGFSLRGGSNVSKVKSAASNLWPLQPFLIIKFCIKELKVYLFAPSLSKFLMADQNFHRNE